MLSLRDARRCRARFPPLKRRAGLVPSLRDGCGTEAEGNSPQLPGGSGGGGATRTLDLGIMRPSLCQLSYAATWGTGGKPSFYPTRRAAVSYESAPLFPS